MSRASGAKARAPALRLELTGCFACAPRNETRRSPVDPGGPSWAAGEPGAFQPINVTCRAHGRLRERVRGTARKTRTARRITTRLAVGGSERETGFEPAT